MRFYLLEGEGAYLLGPLVSSFLASLLISKLPQLGTAAGPGLI